MAYSFSTTMSAKSSEGFNIWNKKTEFIVILFGNQIKHKNYCTCKYGFGTGGSQIAKPPLSGLWLDTYKTKVNHVINVTERSSRKNLKRMFTCR